MGLTRRRARIAGVGALSSGLVGLSLMGAGAYAGEQPGAPAFCPEGSYLYTPALSEAPHSTTTTESTTRSESADTTPTGGTSRTTTTTTTRTVTETLLTPMSGSAEAQTDPFVAPVALDPESFLCIANGQPVPSLPTPVPLPGTSSPVAPYEPGDGTAVDLGTEVNYDPDFNPNPVIVPTTEPTPEPTPESVEPAPGMVELPGSTPAASPSDVPSDTPAAVPTAQPRDVPSDSGPGDSAGSGGTVVLPGTTDGGAVDTSGSITRDQVIARAVSWVLQGVPYSQTSWWTDSNGVYRQDCSGYVSMAWNLNQRNNYWTGNLATVSHRIATKTLKMGDILLLPRSHVVIFAGWANAEKTKFHLFEEYSRGKPARYLTGADLSYYTGRGYGAYRYDRIADVSSGKAGAQRTVYLSAYAETTAPDADSAERDLANTSVALEDLQSVSWSQSLANEAAAEEYAPSAPVGAVTPQPVPELPLETLVEAQLSTDLRASDDPAKSGAGAALIAGGLGLLFLALPLAGAARAGVWTRQYTADRP